MVGSPRLGSKKGLHTANLGGNAGGQMMWSRHSPRLQIAGLLTPAYLWLTAAIFLPLSAMLYFSFLSDMPFGEREWRYTTENYAAFFETGTYALLLWKSIKLGLIVTSVSVLIGFPSAHLLAI